MGKFTQVNVFAVSSSDHVYTCALRMSCKCRGAIDDSTTVSYNGFKGLATLHFECVYVHVCVCVRVCVCVSVYVCVRVRACVKHAIAISSVGCVAIVYHNKLTL